MSTIRDDFAARLGALTNANRATLVKEWAAVFGHPAPRHAQVTLLRGALIWKAQIALEARGEVEQLIRRLRRQSERAPTAVLAPGTRLLREWQGTTHHVTVTADGFEYAGTIHKSLTAISRQITGTAWSGPLFFGLRK
jgi:hypothetical protein